MKSTVDEIRSRFDQDVERFSNLETGQSATIDSPLMLELVAQAAAAATPHAASLLDIGCGAGNYTLKLLEQLPGMSVTLIDLSRPMLDRAVERVSAATTGQVTPIQGDIREIDLGTERFDIVVTAQCLHHLRTDDEWRSVFAAIFKALRPDGSFWSSDFLAHESPAIEAMMKQRHGEYLAQLKDETYRDHVFAYIEREDTPRPLTFQLELLREVGFKQLDVLHKVNRFAAFGGVK